MKRLLKIVLIVFGVLVALIVAAAIILPMVVDPNQYRDDIETLVENKTGRELTIKGDLELSVFPWLGVEIGTTKLANAKGFGDKPMAKIEHAGVSVRLLPLITGQIKIGTVSLQGLRVRLAINESGTSNWQSIVKELASGTKQASQKQNKQPKRDKQQKQSQGGSVLADLSVGGVEISNAAVTYRDARSGTSYKLHDVGLSTGYIELGKPFPVELNFSLDSNKPDVTVTTQLAATVDANVPKKVYRLSDVSLNVDASGSAIPGGQQQVHLTTGALVNLASGHLKVDQFKLQAAGVDVVGHVEGSNILKKPSFNGSLTVQQFSPRELMQRLAIKPPKTSDESVLNKASLQTQFQATLERAQLRNIRIELDDSTLTGKATVKQFVKPVVAFNMTLDQLNVDRYLPPSTKKSKQDSEQFADKTKSDNQKASGPMKISLEPLKAFELDGRLTVGHLVVSNIEFNQAELAVTADNGVLTIKPLAAQLYSGNLHIESRVNAEGSAPGYSIQGTLDNVHLGPLLQDLIGQDKLAALANLTMDLTASGDTIKEIKSSLDGTISFKLKDGVFKGFDLSGILATAGKQLLGKSFHAKNNGKTGFSKFTATFAVENGVLKGSGLNLDTAYGHLTGDGTYNLVTNQVDYTVKVVVPKNAQGDVLEELAGYTIPIELSGNLFSLDYSLNLDEALKNIAEQKLQEEKAELKKKLDKEAKEQKKKLRNKVQEELKGLFQ